MSHRSRPSPWSRSRAGALVEGVVALGLVATAACSTPYHADATDADAKDGGTVAADGAAGGAEAGSGPGAPSSVAVAAVALTCDVTTLAGSGDATFVDGIGPAARFSFPTGVALDAAGNVYVADFGNSAIRKITAGATVTTLAGSGAKAFADGAGREASFANPQGVTVDTAGNVYVADANNNRIRKVTAAGVVTTLAGPGGPMFSDGTGAAARFDYPASLAVDLAGNLYVADTNNHRIRRVTSAGVVTTLAGSATSSFADGRGAAASFFAPFGVVVAPDGSVYASDTDLHDNNRVRKLTPAGDVTTLAGSAARGSTDGTGAAASFASLHGVTADGSGNVYVADSGNHRIRRVTAGGIVTTLAGAGTAAFADGACAVASFSMPLGLVADTAGNLFVADSSNNRIRRITTAGIGALAVTWVPAATASADVTGFVATASASGLATQTCSANGTTSCVVRGLTSGIPYTVTVVAVGRSGASAPSAPATAQPN